jgi:hypothetical protein
MLAKENGSMRISNDLDEKKAEEVSGKKTERKPASK